MEYVKIYGERNTGTQFAQRMIQQNFQCKVIPGTLADCAPGYRDAIEQEITSCITDKAKQLIARQARIDEYFRGNLWNTLGWKHAVPPIDVINTRPDRHKVLFVTVTKNPYAWALSLFRRPYENLCIRHPEHFADFLREPWLTVGRENAPTFLKSPVELWNLKVEGYRRLTRSVTVLHLRYEDIIANPEGFLGQVARYLERRGAEFSIHTDAVKKQDSGKDIDYYRNYYLNERWRDSLGNEHIDLINRVLDSSLVEAAGYKMLASSSPMTN